MNHATPALNKRTVLGGQFCAFGVLTLEVALLALLLVAVGVYLVLEPTLSSVRNGGPSRFLL
ncbi:hypothetical protein [Halorussus sp. MSC15.2]|uniref:hypothetical protein n=1 Tax=Halorussus sp. MSC15.2 TaxID=2283638 RepID=UPI0013D4F79A|nr:hypothetical protein [Halorussus sp. MSC15.2]NEU57395.1 hypothetical protein [Halorussus sp. MSC15.2]